MENTQYLDFEGLKQYDAIVEEKIRKAVGQAVAFAVIVVDNLPEIGEEHTLYLLKKSSEEIHNICDEYIWVRGETSETGSWELIGNTQIDLSQYATIESVNAGLALKQNIIDDLSTIRENASLGATALQPNDISSWAKQPNKSN